MNLREIIMDAIKYPISDTRKFLIFCVLVILMSLSTKIGRASCRERVFRAV